MSHITWGVCRAPDGSPLRTVFCLDCREVFGRYLTGIENMDVLEQAKATHSCPVCNATIESKQEEDLIDQHGTAIAQIVRCRQCREPQQGVSRIETGYEGRPETRQILHHLAAIDTIAEMGLLDFLKANV